MIKNVWFAIEMVDRENADDHYVLAKNVEELVNYVRANADDACTFRINAVEPSTLAQDRIAEAFPKGPN